MEAKSFRAKAKAFMSRSTAARPQFTAGPIYAAVPNKDPKEDYDGSYLPTYMLPGEPEETSKYTVYNVSRILNGLALVMFIALTITSFTYVGVQYNETTPPRNVNSTGTNPLYGHLTYYLGDSRQFSVTYRAAWIPCVIVGVLLHFVIGNAWDNGLRFSMDANAIMAFIHRSALYWNSWLVGVAVIGFSSISFVALNIAGTTDIATLLLYALVSGLVAVVGFMIQDARNTSYQSALSNWALAKAAATALCKLHNNNYTVEGATYSEADILSLMPEGTAHSNQYGRTVISHNLDPETRREMGQKLYSFRAINDAIVENVVDGKDLQLDKPPVSIYLKGNNGVMLWSAVLIVLLAFSFTIGLFSLSHQWANLRDAQRALAILNFIFKGIFALCCIVIGCWGVKSGHPMGYHPSFFTNMVVLYSYVLVMCSLSLGSFFYDGEFRSTN